MVGSIAAVERTVHVTNTWLNELAEILGGDETAAYRALRAGLHALRDRLAVEDAARLAAELPTFVRGIFYEGWTPGAAPGAPRGTEDMLRQIASEALLRGEPEAAGALQGVLQLLGRHVAAEELRAALAALPEGLTASAAARS
jgi:uncharacterized protein (DUF2267 family)